MCTYCTSVDVFVLHSSEFTTQTPRCLSFVWYVLVYCGGRRCWCVASSVHGAGGAVCSAVFAAYGWYDPRVRRDKTNTLGFC